MNDNWCIAICCTVLAISMASCTVIVTNKVRIEMWIEELVDSEKEKIISEHQQVVAEFNREIKDRADTEASLSKILIEDGEKIAKLEACIESLSKTIEEWRVDCDGWKTNASQLAESGRKMKAALKEIWNKAGTALQSVVPQEAKEKLVQEIKDEVSKCLNS